MTMTKYAFLLALSLLFWCCGDREDALLIGAWEASQVLENGDSLRLDPSEVGFSFTPNNRYVFRSTLRYTEAGTWRYDNGFLFARDTTNTAAEERIVAIEKLTADSLEIRMMAGEQERRITLLKD